MQRAKPVGGKLTDETADAIKGIDRFRDAVLAASLLLTMASDTPDKPEGGILRKEISHNFIFEAAMPFFAHLRSWVLPAPPKADEHGQFLLFDVE